MDSSPGTAAAAAAAAAVGVEVVSALNREWTRDPLIFRSICFRRRILVNIMFGTMQMDVYMNMYVSEAAVPQIRAIR